MEKPTLSRSQGAGENIIKSFTIHVTSLQVWNWKHKFDELDLQKGASGCELDELNAHRYYEICPSMLCVLKRLSAQFLGALWRVYDSEGAA